MQVRMTIRITNFVGGKFHDSLDGAFSVSSPFFDYAVDVPNSCVLDLGDAFSVAKKAQVACASLSFEARREILKKAAERFIISDEELAHLVKMQGMPIRFVKQHAMYSRELFFHTANAAERRHGHALGHLGESMDVHGFELSLPPEGIAVAFIPPNDPAEAAFVLSHVVMSGAVIIIKPSQQEPYMALKIASLLTECGYPPGGINVVHWNTADATRSELTHFLLRDSKYRIFMGDYDSAHTMFASVENRNAKNCIFSAGKSKAIVDDGADLERTAESIIESSLYWTNNCVSTKSVIVVGEQNAKRLSEILERKFRDFMVGDPFNPDTTIGYVDEKTLDELEQVARGQNDFSYAHFHHNFVRVNKFQMNPLLVWLPHPDAESPFVSHEFPYTLAVMSVPTFEDAVHFVNEASGFLLEKKSMAVSLYATEASFTDFAKSNPGKLKSIIGLKSHLLFYNKPSTCLSPHLRHQGTDLTGFLSRPMTIVDSKI